MIAEEGKGGRKIGERWSAILVPSPAASDTKSNFRVPDQTATGRKLKTAASGEIYRLTCHTSAIGIRGPSGTATMPKLLAMTPELDPDLRLHAAAVSDWIATMSATRSA